MKKILLANGCSWTAGGGLTLEHTKPLPLAQRLWPHHLKNLLNFDECHNISRGCGSNQRIVRTTFNWLLKQDKETLKNTVAVIQWSELSRYEYYHPTSDTPYEDIPRNWALVKTGLLISAADPIGHSPNAIERSQRRYETYTDIEGLYVHLQHLETLHSLFKDFGVTHYFWNFTYPYGLVEHPLAKFMLERYPWLEPNGLHKWEYERISSHDPHPSIEGHRQIAVHIKDSIEKYYA